MQVSTRIAGALGALAVVLGAFGAHYLEGKVSDGTMTARSLEIWRTGVLYHLIHAVALLWASQRSSTLLVWLWTSGIVCFSGSLYLLALFGWHWLGPVTPLGGLLFIAGWATLVFKPKI